MNTRTENLLNKYKKKVTELDISNKNICGILDLERFPNLKVLNCSKNKITEITNMPHTLVSINNKNKKIKKI